MPPAAGVPRAVAYATPAGHWAAALATRRGVRSSRIRRSIAVPALLAGPGANLVLLPTVWSLHPPRCLRA